MNYLDATYPDINNGNGLRVTLWLSGCSHHCKNCHNPQTWDESAGKLFDEKAKEHLYDILSLFYIEGITFSGGDPLFDGNIENVDTLISEIKKYFPNKTIWLYTGFTWDEIKNDPQKMSVVNKCDVVVDGEYIDSLQDLSLAWRGSSNQNVIDVKKTLDSNTLIVWENEKDKWEKVEKH